MLLGDWGLAARDWVAGDQPPPLRSPESAGDHTGNVPDGLRTQHPRLLGLAVMPTALQEPTPFATEMKCRDFAQRHGQQLRSKIGCQFPVPFDGLEFQFLLLVLAKEFLEQHRVWWGEPRQPWWHRPSPVRTSAVPLSDASPRLQLPPVCLRSRTRQPGGGPSQWNPAR